MVCIKYIRDGLVEEFHEGIVKSEGFNCHWDSPSNDEYYMRSCAKPIQATLLIDYNIHLEEDELALCCGSHAGEDCHIKTAQKLLRKFNIDESYLKCGIHAPLSRTMQNKMLIDGRQPTSIHNNCSGKHIAFLILCKKNGWDLNTYYELNHPLQIEIKNKINSMCNVQKNYQVTTDGCGVPILSMPLKNMLYGYINLTKYPQIINAIKNNPYIFGGENRTDTEIIQKTNNIIAKVGAGGLCIVLNYKEKKAFAVKINDCSTDARRFAVFEIINKLNWGNIEYDNTIKTLQGKIVGKVSVEL